MRRWCPSTRQPTSDVERKGGWLPRGLHLNGPPQEFLDVALSLEHPYDARAEPPDDLRSAIRFWARSPLNVLERHVSKFFDFWHSRAKELASDEESLHGALPHHLARVLRGKRLLLLFEMAAATGHPDTTVVPELAGGFTLAGEVPHSGAFPLRSGEDCVLGESEEWLSQRAHAVRASLGSALGSRPLAPDILPEVAAATFKEIDAGWVDGPFPPPK